MIRLSRFLEARRGISLLEVLITMFVVSVGLLSVFGLFMAGRELEARALILGRADAFANGQGRALAEAWLRAGQWQRYERGAGFRWVFYDGSGNTTNAVKLPVIVDPWALASDTFAGGPASGPWDWDFFAPSPTSLPFARITLPRVEQSPRDTDNDPNNNIPANAPIKQDQALGLFADLDSIEFDTDAVALNPPLNAFDLGRRRRGTDLSAALYLDKRDDLPRPSSAVTTASPVAAWLLIFHKPIPGYETAVGGSRWPAGFIKLNVAFPPSQNLLEATLDSDFLPSDNTVIRRSMRAGKWALVIRERGPAGGPFEYDTCWAKMVSASTNNNIDWLVILDGEVPSTLTTVIQATDVNNCYLLASECLVLVRALGNFNLLE